MKKIISPLACLALLVCNALMLMSFDYAEDTDSEPKKIELNVTPSYSGGSTSSGAVQIYPGVSAEGGSVQIQNPSFVVIPNGGSVLEKVEISSGLSSSTGIGGIYKYESITPSLKLEHTVFAGMNSSFIDSDNSVYYSNRATFISASPIVDLLNAVVLFCICLPKIIIDTFKGNYV